MTGSAVVDTIVGLVSVFYALALICTGLVELIANAVKKRAKFLLRGLRDLLDGPTDVAENAFAGVGSERKRYQEALTADSSGNGRANASAILLADVMGHPLVLPFKHTTPAGKPTRNPPYLPASVFAKVLVDLVTPDGVKVTTARIATGLTTISDSPELTKALKSLLKFAGDDVDKFLAATEEWFNNQMDRVTGSYKRWAKRWVIVIAVVVVGIGGIDSVAVTRTLYSNDAIRAAVAQSAAQHKPCSATDSADVCAQASTAFLQHSGLPLGWSKPNPNDGIWGWPLKILGLLISVGAAAVGAPFWYKVLDRIGSLRNSGPKPTQ
jgi:hypothetical protein